MLMTLRSRCQTVSEFSELLFSLPSLSPLSPPGTVSVTCFLFPWQRLNNDCDSSTSHRAFSTVTRFPWRLSVALFVSMVTTSPELDLVSF